MRAISYKKVAVNTLAKDKFAYCFAAIKHIRQSLSWEGVTMALAASAFAYYFGYGCRSQYSCGIDKAHLFKRVCKGAATRAIVTPEHDTIKNMDKIVFLCYYVNRNCEVEEHGCHKLYR